MNLVVKEILLMKAAEYPGEKVCEQREQRTQQLLQMRGEIGMDSAGSDVSRDGFPLEVLVSAEVVLHNWRGHQVQ